MFNFPISLYEHFPISIPSSYYSLSETEEDEAEEDEQEAEEEAARDQVDVGPAAAR